MPFLQFHPLRELFVRGKAELQEETQVLIVTIACWNYIPRALQLAHSIRQSGIDATLVACLVEPSQPLPLVISEAFDRVLFVSDLTLPDFDTFMFRHTAMEASTAIKARLLLHLLTECPSESLFVYLDPDIWVFSAFDELMGSLAKGDVFVTPHLLRNEASPEDVGEGMFSLLKGGVFNLGFLAIQRSEESFSFLDWLKDRTDLWCYNDTNRGLFVEQKWIDLATGFSDLVVLRQPGYNIAHWNITKRQITFNTGTYLVNGLPLRFIHFSGLVGRDPAIVENRLSRVPRDNYVRQLIPAYLSRLDALGQQEYRNTPWFFSRFQSGEPIAIESRVVFRQHPSLSQRFPNPFTESNRIILAAVGETP